MAVAERIRDIGRERVSRFTDILLEQAERYRPTEVVYRADQIVFSRYRQKEDGSMGPKLTVLTDLEGTFTEFGALDPDAQIAAHFRNAHAAEGDIENLGVVTNVRPDTRRNFIRLAHGIDQIGADDAFVPLGPEDPKPSSRMLFKAMQKYGSLPENTIYIGDQLVDVVAARRAGIRAIWIDRLGEADHLGVKYLRRPLNAPVRLWARLSQSQPSTPESAAADMWRQIYESGWTQPTNATDVLCETAQELPPELIALGRGRIHGYGGEIIQLHPDIESKIPPPWYEKFTRVAKEAMDKSGFRDYMWRNGRFIADTLTESREVSRYPVAALIVASEFVPGLEYFASNVNRVVTLTDLLDGLSAGMSEGGKTQKGGEDDAKKDKAYFGTIRKALLIRSGIRAAKIALKEHRIDPDFVIRAALYAGVKARDQAMTQRVRPALNDQGINTDAIASGKFSTNVQAVAIDVDIADKHALAALILNAAEGAAKAYSLVQEPFGWVRKHDKENYDSMRLDQIEAELRAKLAS